MLVIQAVAPVVLLGDLIEHVRPDEARLLALMPDPGRRTQVTRGRITGNGLLQFRAGHEGTVVVTGAQIGDGGKNGNAPDAQAASCRAAGTPHNAGSTVAGMAPR